MTHCNSTQNQGRQKLHREGHEGREGKPHREARQGREGILFNNPTRTRLVTEPRFLIFENYGLLRVLSVLCGKAFCLSFASLESVAVKLYLSGLLALHQFDDLRPVGIELLRADARDALQRVE